VGELPRLLLPLVCNLVGLLEGCGQVFEAWGILRVGEPARGLLLQGVMLWALLLHKGLFARALEGDGWGLVSAGLLMQLGVSLNPADEFSAMAHASERGGCHLLGQREVEKV
jgi:hypothetical protein